VRQSDWALGPPWSRNARYVNRVGDHRTGCRPAGVAGMWYGGFYSY